MKPKSKPRSSLVRTLLLAASALVVLVWLVRIFTRNQNIALLNAKGLVAQQQRGLMMVVVGIMLILAIPVLLSVCFIAWKYRESNHRAKYEPNFGHGRLLDLNMWFVPAAFAVILAVIMYPATHRLEPQKAIGAEARPLTIQVVSLRWKWLFIYPEQNIATVNFVQLPLNTPVTFELTADEAPMSSFWIPNLGGQLYTMTGMVNRLNLVAEVPGDYPGSSAEINGAGFAGMKFTARAKPVADFEDWVRQIKYTYPVLDAEAYSQLVKPSEDTAPTFYAAAEPGLYNNIVSKYLGPAGSQAAHGAGH